MSTDLDALQTAILARLAHTGPCRVERLTGWLAPLRVSGLAVTAAVLELLERELATGGVQLAITDDGRAAIAPAGECPRCAALAAYREAHTC